MKWSIAAALVLAFCAGPASAAGYDDFTLGMTANLRDEYEQAIQAFTAALAAPDLPAVYKPAAFRGRAAAYLEQDKCAEAMDDLKSFEALHAIDRSFLRLRLWVNLCLKNAEAARRDLDTVAKGKLDEYDLWGFARLEWRYGLYEVAAATAGDAFAKADKKEYITAYMLLWRLLAETRAGKFDAGAASRALADLKYNGWPRPIFDFYLGKLTPSQLQEKASSFWNATELEHRCEANFYTAEWQLARNDNAAATALLQDVVKTCAIDLLERGAAKSELRRLGVPVPKE